MKKPFYGWVIVGVAFLIGMTEAGTFQNILSIFMKPMVHEFGWSRTSVTGAIAFGSILAGLVSPFVGPVIDRHGPRMVAFWGIFFLSMGLAGMTFVSRIWQLYVYFGMGRLIAIGVLSMAITVSVSNWFVRKRGRAMGITWLGPRLGSALLPLLVQFFILYMGWRLAWSGLGLVVFLMSGIPALLFLRRRPEDMGLLPDGDTFRLANGEIKNSLEETNRTNAPAVDSEPAWTRFQAIRTKSFWMITLLNSLIPFLQGGINFHIYPLLTDQGFSEVNAVLVLTVINVFGALGSVIWGLFSERFQIQRLMAINVFGNAVVFLLLFWVVRLKTSGMPGIGVVFFLSALNGILFGGRNPMLNLLWAEFFGRKSLGSIMGFSNPFRMTANAIGPVFAAFCFDLTGSYGFPFYLFAVFFVVSGVISLMMKPPKMPVL